MDLEKGFGEIFQTVEDLTKTCNSHLVGRLDTLAENNLNLAMELTSHVVGKSDRDVFWFKIISVALTLATVSILGFLTRHTSKTLKDSLTEVVGLISELEKGNFRWVETKTELTEFKPLLNSFMALKGGFEGLISGMLSSNKVISSVVKEERLKIEKVAPLSAQVNSLTTKADAVGRELSELLASIKMATDEMRKAINRDLPEDPSDTRQGETCKGRFF